MTLNQKSNMKYIVYLIVTAFGLGLFYMVFVFNFTNTTLINYSDGERTGLINKISHKGFVCKTWEGYMLVGNGQNVNPETFSFTVKSDEIAKQIESKSGTIATIIYRQYGLTANCWGDTQYEITGVK